MNRGLFIKLKGLLCGYPSERLESRKLNFWPPGCLEVVEISLLGWQSCIFEPGFPAGRQPNLCLFAAGVS